MSTIRGLFYNEGADILYEALERRAKRNFRTVRTELLAILAEVLREEVRQIETEHQRQGGERDALPR